ETTDTETVAIGTTVTVNVAAPLTPSLAALMPAVPVALAVTTPSAVTVATLASLDDQVSARPESTCPFASLSVATAIVVSPTFSEVADSTTKMLATGAGPVGPSP